MRVSVARALEGAPGNRQTWPHRAKHEGQQHEDQRTWSMLRSFSWTTVAFMAVVSASSPPATETRTLGILAATRRSFSKTTSAQFMLSERASTEIAALRASGESTRVRPSGPNSLGRTPPSTDSRTAGFGEDVQ